MSNNKYPECGSSGCEAYKAMEGWQRNICKTLGINENIQNDELDRLLADYKRSDDEFSKLINENAELHYSKDLFDRVLTVTGYDIFVEKTLFDEDIEEVLSNIESVYTHYDELVEENKEWKAENQRLRQELEQEKAISKSKGENLDNFYNWQKTQTESGKKIEELTKALEEIVEITKPISENLCSQFVLTAMLANVNRIATQPLKGGE
jgi:regulator of replication initiation timing